MQQAQSSDSSKGKGEVLRSSDTYWMNSLISLEARIRRNQHPAFIVWFTGLSGSGKSTMAVKLEEYLFSKAYQVFLLDGDNLRHGLCGDLKFSAEDRVENIRRAGEVSKLLMMAGNIVTAAFISPFQRERNLVRDMVPEGRFFEIYCKSSLDACESRDPKKLYQKARAGLIPNFTGISSPYEIPADPALVVDTENQSVDESFAVVCDFFTQKGLFPK